MGKIMTKNSIKLRVVGLNFSRFLKEAGEKNVEIFRLKRKSVKVHEFWVSVKAYEVILECTESKNFEITVIERLGAKDIFLRMISWSGILLGIGLGCFLAFFSSRYVQKIDIIGSENHVCENGERCIFER